MLSHVFQLRRKVLCKPTINTVKCNKKIRIELLRSMLGYETLENTNSKKGLKEKEGNRKLNSLSTD